MKVSMGSIYKGSNVRKGESDVSGLKTSLDKHGLIMPLAVRKAENGEANNGADYMLIAGYRRYEAAKELGWEEIDVHILESAEDINVLQIAENTFRADMTLHDEVVAIEEYLTTYKMSVDQIAGLFGHSTTWVRSRLKLANLVPELKEMIEPEHAQSLAEIASYDTKKQEKAISEMCDQYDVSDPKELLEDREWRDVIWNIKSFLDDDENELGIAGFPWDLKDERFGQACAGCEYRSSNQLGVFSEVMEDEDRCTNLTCLSSKLEEVGKFFDEKTGEHGLKLNEDLRYYYGVSNIIGKQVDERKELLFKELMVMDDEAIDALFKEMHLWSGIRTGDSFLGGDSKIVFATTKKIESDTKSAESGKAESSEVQEGIKPLSTKKLYRYLHPLVGTELYSRLIELEPELNGERTYRLMGYALFYDRDVLGLFGGYGNRSYYDPDDWFDAQDGAETGMVNFHRRFVISVIRVLFAYKNMWTLVGKDAIAVHQQRYFHEDEIEEKVPVLSSDVEVSKNEGDSKWLLPSIAEVLDWNFIEWFQELVEDEEKRKFILGLFTKSELLNALGEEDRKGLSSKPKKAVVDVVAEKYPNSEEGIAFPYETDLFTDEVGWMKERAQEVVDMDMVKMFLDPSYLSKMATDLSKV